MQENCEHVLPADIDDEPDLRLQRPHIREVLLRPNAEINTSRFRELLQRRNDILNTRFIRDPVITGVKPLRLREVGDHAPELLIADLVRQTNRWSKLKRHCTVS